VHFETLLLMEDHIDSIPVVLILLSFTHSFHIEMWPLLTTKHENCTLHVYIVVVGANQVKVLISVCYLTYTLGLFS
jgi:hypothetical protein